MSSTCWQCPLRAWNSRSICQPSGQRPASRPRGGVVTQRTANPCTPVRFRARPPFISSLIIDPFLPQASIRTRRLSLPAQGSASSRSAFPERTTCDLSSPPAPPTKRQIEGEHQQSKRKHPESKHRQESENSAENEAHAQCDSQGRRAAADQTPLDPIRISPRPALNVKNFFRVIVTRAVRGG
jgi:hypothetical protein